uniref:Uncharacterized protein n=1 Tax=Amphimedon queenslandica TaxID=400682 RepID=A0A1X7V3I9_AMPQE
MDVQESRAGSSSHNFDQADQPDADETIDEDKVNILDPSPQKKSFKLRLKRGQHHFNKWLDNTSIHGIVHVFKGRSRLRRILWLLVFLFASTTCAGIIIFYIVLWAQDPTSTSISFITDDEGQSFPAVTVCNLNAVKKDYADQYVVDLLNNYANPTSGFIQNWPFSNISRSCTDSLNSITIEDQQEKLFDAYTNGGNKIDDFVVYCGFAGSDGNIVRCEESLEPVFTSLGVCFTFNSAYNGQPDRKVTLAGPQFGLILFSMSVYQSIQG